MLRPWWFVTLWLVGLTGCGLLDDLDSEPSDDPCVVDPSSCLDSPQPDPGLGSVTVNATGSDDVFLLWVQSIPTGTSVADNYVTFTLDGMGGSVAGALTATDNRRSQAMKQGRSAQLEFDQRRREGIDRLVQAMQRGERRVVPWMRTLSGHHPCGSNEIEHEGGCVSRLTLNWGTDDSRVFEVQEYVEVNGQLFYVLVDVDDLGNAAQARAAVIDFASTFEKEHSILGLDGHIGTLDHNADGAITIAFSNYTGAGVSSGVAGFFDYRDMLPPSDAEATGNNMDILWARTPGASNPQVQTVATLAHEYSHLASFSKRVSGQGTAASQEALWLDEGIAHTVEDLLGWGLSNIDAVELTLSEWSDSALAGPVDSIANRGMAYLFLRHLIDTKAKSLGATDAADPEVEAAAAAVLGPILNGAATGFEHPSLAGLSDSAHAEWLLATFATGGSYLEAAHRADFLPPAIASTGHKTGMDTRGLFSNAAGDSVPLDGPAYEDFDDLDSMYEGELLESGSLFLMLTDLEAGAHTITGTADEGTNLRMHVERLE